MPCNQTFYDRSGKLLGVAGLDLSMDTVIEQMDMPEVAGVTKELGALGIPELEEHAIKGTTSGFVMDGSDVLVFARLKALPWTLVARVDAVSHGL